MKPHRADPTGRMVAGIYARKSTEQKNTSDEAKSVTRQIEHATAYAERHGWTVDRAHVYVDDGISGAEFEKRPQFMRMMHALKPRPPFQVLITMDESRLGRDQFQTGHALWQIIDAGVRVFYYLPDREVKLDNATSGFLEQVKLFAAQIERENTAHRTRDAMVRKAQAGHVTGGIVFGYDNVPQLGPDGKRSHTDREVNAKEAAVVVRIFEMARDGLGLTRIAKALNRDIAPAPKPRHQHRRAAWCPTSIREVLRRRLYVGEVVWDRRGAHPIRVAKPALRIISDALWATVHARLAHTRAQYLKSTSGKLWGRPATGIAGQHLLSRLAACGKCGGPLYVRSSTWGSHRKFFYACLAYHTRGVRGCSNGRPIPMTVADAAVVDAVEHDLLRMEVIEAGLSRAIEAARQDDDHADTSRDALHARLGDAQDGTAALHRGHRPGRRRAANRHRGDHVARSGAGQPRRRGRATRGAGHRARAR